MPRTKPSPDLNTASPTAIMIGGNLGGIGKSSQLTVLADSFRIAGKTLDLLQLDEQSKVSRMTGQPVVSINLAVFQNTREDEWAVQRAMRPIYDTIISMAQTGRCCAIETAGGMSAIAHDAFAIMDLVEETEELGIKIDAHILIVASEESLKQMLLETERHRSTFPGGRIIYVLNNRLGNVRTFIDEVADDLRLPILELLANNPHITMHRVAPPTMKLWEKLAVSPFRIAQWRIDGGYTRIMAETGLDRLEAKLFAGEIVGWAANIREQLVALYPMLETTDAQP
jgi:hypothetical protein